MVNWALKWNITVNYRCVPFEPKFKILKDFSNTVFVILEDYLWSKFLQDRKIFGGVRAKNLPKKAISRMLNQYETLFTFTTTNAILMKLTIDIYLNKVFHLAEFWGVTHGV